jgi:chromatin segregation and condensation protein Rec8/ScpA/Scc1 (kleisin family)
VLQPYIDEFKPAIEDLRARAEVREHLFFRSPEGAESYELPIEYTQVSVADLSRALERLIARAKPDDFEAPTKPQRSLSEMMIVVMRALPQDPRPLDEIVTGEFTRSEVVWWFLALLELIRLGQARATLKDGDVLFRAHRE